MAVIIDAYHLSDFAVICIESGIAIISDKNREKNVKYKVTGSFLKKDPLQELDILKMYPYLILIYP